MENAERRADGSRARMQLLDPAAPLTVTLRIGRTAHLAGPDGESSPDPAGLALGTVTLAAQPAAA